MNPDHNLVRRLAFIRYLYQAAVSQSYGPGPLKSASILMLHDAVELFLQLASEHLNAGAAQPSFMDYWDLLSRKLHPKELAQKESMRRLNRARVALKHHGTSPSDLDIEAFRADTTSFFEDNTPVVFGINLDEVSLVEYVNPEESRTLLREAQGAIRSGQILDALDKIAVAYAEMVRDYEDRKRERFGGSPFYFGRDLTFQSAFFMGLHGGSSEERKLSEFVDRVRESIEAMQSAVKVLALGIDYRKYSRFKRLTPHVMRTMGGHWHLQRGRFDEGSLPAAEDALFCLDFVIESAFALGEFDYSTRREA